MTSSDKASFDQHFLVDQHILMTMIDYAHLKTEDIVLEVGPGKGDITKHLAQKVKKVYAVEIDQSFKPYLDALPRNVEVLYGTILEKIDSIPCTKLAANIPFSLSEPLLKKIIKTPLQRAVLLTGSRFFTVLSDSTSKLGKITSLFFTVTKIMDVQKTAFFPKPRVLSALLVLERRTRPLTRQEQLLKEVVLQDDKKLKNGLLYGLMRRNNCTKNEARKFIAHLDLPDSILEKNIHALSTRHFQFLCERLS